MDALQIDLNERDKDLDSMILVSPFQLGIFCDSTISVLQRSHGSGSTAGLGGSSVMVTAGEPNMHIDAQCLAIFLTPCHLSSFYRARKLTLYMR